MNRRSFLAAIVGAVAAGPKAVAKALKPKPLTTLNLGGCGWIASNRQPRGRIDFISADAFRAMFEKAMVQVQAEVGRSESMGGGEDV